jgi:PHP family Zn ribbon phosphoesterase
MSSDAHYLKDIGGAATRIVLQKPTFAELKMAFAKKNGRHILEQ